MKTSDLTPLISPSTEDRADVAAAFARLVALMAHLRGPDGCAWDAKQTLESLKGNLIEEAYEVVDAIDTGSVDDHREELGDLLLQIVFQADIQRDAGHFNAGDVAHEIADKLIRRHPHVFQQSGRGRRTAPPGSWEAIKRQEKSGRSAIGGVPRALPALMRAQRITQKASRVGFDWPDVRGPLEKLAEELDELREAVVHDEPARVQAEFGDFLFSMVNLARFLKVDAEDALRGTVDRFERRFTAMEEAAKSEGRALDELSLEELEDRWQAAKRSVG